MKGMKNHFVVSQPLTPKGKPIELYCNSPS